MTDHEISAAVQEALDALTAKGYARAEVCIDFCATSYAWRDPSRWSVSMYGADFSAKLHHSRHATAVEAVEAMRHALVSLSPQPSQEQIAATLGLHPDGTLIGEPAYAVAAE